MSLQFIMTQSYYLRSLEKFPLKLQMKIERKMLLNLSSLFPVPSFVEFLIQCSQGKITINLVKYCAFDISSIIYIAFT